jgi:hypothetical protein
MLLIIWLFWNIGFHRHVVEVNTIFRQIIFIYGETSTAGAPAVVTLRTRCHHDVKTLGGSPAFSFAMTKRAYRRRMSGVAASYAARAFTECDCNTASSVAAGGGRAAAARAARAATARAVWLGQTAVPGGRPSAAGGGRTVPTVATAVADVGGRRLVGGGASAAGGGAIAVADAEAAGGMKGAVGGRAAVAAVVGRRVAGESRVRRR